MTKSFGLLLILVFFLEACVSKEDHEKVISERDAITMERDTLKLELQEIKFGAPNLLSDGKMFYDTKEFQNARKKFQLLIDKHPDMPQSIEAQKFLSSIDEEELWNNASNSQEVSVLEKYISRYSTGKYIQKAYERMGELKVLNMKREYESALSQNTSSDWKTFLTNYPDHADAAEIKRRIIQLEVDEILGYKETGKMPTFNEYQSNYSSNSVVEIKNNTRCELTVRYSGPDVKMIVIPEGESQSVYLSSGDYKIVATACGTNYAGIENLHGSYGSTFYITTSRY